MRLKALYCFFFQRGSEFGVGGRTVIAPRVIFVHKNICKMKSDIFIVRDWGLVQSLTEILGILFDYAARQIAPFVVHLFSKLIEGRPENASRFLPFFVREKQLSG